MRTNWLAFKQYCKKSHEPEIEVHLTEIPEIEADLTETVIKKSQIYPNEDTSLQKTSLGSLNKKKEDQ